MRRLSPGIVMRERRSPKHAVLSHITGITRSSTLLPRYFCSSMRMGCFPRTTAAPLDTPQTFIIFLQLTETAIHVKAEVAAGMGDIVAAIDVGTSRTAYSYTVIDKDDMGKPQVQLGIPDRLSDATMSLERKTATAVLLNRSDKDEGGWRLQTFGDSAEADYLYAKMDGDGGEDLALFKHFKMELFRGGREGKGGRKVDNVMVIAADNRVTLPLVYVMSLALQHIKAQIIDRLNSSGQVTLRSSDIRFVLTLPAIWSEFGKSFMRTAAFRGGLIDSKHDQENLALCLEPEAAILSVEKDYNHPWKRGTQVMVLDCGGGTIDIATHEVISTSPLKLKEVEEPTGGPWGSTVVDSKFKAFLKDVLGCTDEAWDKLDKSTQMLSLMQDWESKKTDYQEGRSVRLQLSDILDQIEMDVETFTVSVGYFASTMTGVKATGRVLKIEPELMSSFFEDAFKEIVRVSREVLDKHPGISMVFMVGGFSSSPLLQKAVTSGLRDDHGAVRVIASRRPSLAIVLGAALFGANQGPFISRKARLTYGTAAMTKYDVRDPAHSKDDIEMSIVRGKLYLKTFAKYVERGEDLPVGTDKEHEFKPMTEDQQKVKFDILVTKQCAADVQYIRDSGVKRMLHNPISVTVPMDMTASFARRGVSMRLSFGGAELGITCKRHSDGMKVEVDTIYVEDIEKTSYGGTVWRPYQG